MKYFLLIGWQDNDGHHEEWTQIPFDPAEPLVPQVAANLARWGVLPNLGDFHDILVVAASADWPVSPDAALARAIEDASRARTAASAEADERAELARLLAKYGVPS